MYMLFKNLKKETFAVFLVFLFLFFKSGFNLDSRSRKFVFKFINFLKIIICNILKKSNAI